MDGQGTLQSPGYNEPAKKKAKKVEKDKGSTSKAKPSYERPVKPADKPTKSSTDSKIAELDQKWSDRFNHLEALLMARSLDNEPTFQTVKVEPTHSPPAGVVRSSDPFIEPADRPAKHQSTNKSGIDRPHSDRPMVSDSSSTDPPVLHKQCTSQVATERTRKDSVSSLDSYAESDQSDRPPMDLYVEEGELSGCNCYRP